MIPLHVHLRLSPRGPGNCQTHCGVISPLNARLSVTNADQRTIKQLSLYQFAFRNMSATIFSTITSYFSVDSVDSEIIAARRMLTYLNLTLHLNLIKGKNVQIQTYPPSSSELHLAFSRGICSRPMQFPLTDCLYMCKQLRFWMWILSWLFAQISLTFTLAKSRIYAEIEPCSAN